MLVLLELGERGLEQTGQRLLRLVASGASVSRDLAGGLGGVGAADLRRQLRVGGVALGLTYLAAAAVDLAAWLPSRLARANVLRAPMRAPT